MNRLSIGTLSAKTGVKVPTIRYYESIGLLPAPPRSEGNRRTYGETDVRRLHFVRHARELGFDLPAIRQLLRLAESSGDQPCDDADAIASAHLGAIESKISRLVAMREELRRMADCTPGTIAECRVIEILAEHGHNHPAPDVGGPARRQS